MKKLIISLVIVASLGCSTAINDQTITSAVSIGTSAGLKLAVRDSAKRTVVANYLYVAAGALRTISGTPTADQLTTQINAFIPTNIKAEYPEVLAFVIPLIVSNYQIAKDKYGNDVKKLYQGLNDIATGIESGASVYKTP